jgi:hypothetical protein
MCGIMTSESQNAMEMAMADGVGGPAIEAGAPGEGRASRPDLALRGVRMLERLVAGSSLTEVAAGEGLSPRRARELVAEVVAQRGFDP